MLKSQISLGRGRLLLAIARREIGEERRASRDKLHRHVLFLVQ